ncbi:MAG: prepilin-type N-terminal cleavage/methylation protein [Amnibacterium sp.]|nr:prepilin-type N-terminal cleavage/methylation protein [Amnibacterium sp.]
MPRPQADAGMTLIEVVVALLVFAIIASGIVAGMTTIARMTSDDRSRVVAANLAAEQTDLARAIGDPFKVTTATTTQSFPTPDGATRAFTIKRSISWVSSSGADISCGSGTNLFFLRVHVLVTWDGELPTTAPVQTDTVLAPAGRITDPTSGTIAVSVVGSDGLPMAGVSVSIVPTSGGSSLASQPDPTNVDGCTYETKVAPGTYAVTIGKSGYIDVNQNTAPSKPVVVTVGTTQSVSFQYDRGATFPVVYANTYTPAGQAMAAHLPTDLDTTFINSTAGLYITHSPAASILLHPFSTGYTAVAGVLGTSSAKTTCAAVDPAGWSAAKVSGTDLAAGQRGGAVAAAPGATAADLDVPMGVVWVKASAAGYLKAVQSNASPLKGQPDCKVPSTYVFGNVLKNGTVAVALPYGTWTLYSGSTAAAQVTPIVGANLSSPTNALPNNVSGAGVVTLDPRAAG